MCWASQVVLVVNNPPANSGDVRDMGSIPGSGRSPREKARQPTLVFFPGESPGQRSLVGYSPLGHKESDTTEQLTHMHLCACSVTLVVWDSSRSHRL